MLSHSDCVATSLGHNNRGLVALCVWLAQRTALSSEQGAAPLIYLATSAAVSGVTGAYFVKKRSVESSVASYAQAAAQRL
jgi:hypothetical protein